MNTLLKFSKLKFEIIVDAFEKISCLSNVSLRIIDFKLKIEASSGILPLSEITNLDEICNDITH